YVQSNYLKRAGYERALSESGITLDENLIVKNKGNYDGGKKSIQKLLNSDYDIKHVFVVTDETSLGVIHGAQDLGYNVPEDIEVISFNKSRIAMIIRHTLTTVMKTMYNIGAVAMRLITKYINKEEVEKTEVILTHRIIERDSTKN